MKKFPIVALVCLLSVVAIAQPQWRALDNAPSGLGRFDDIFFLNGDLGWAANGPSGEVYKTTDGGMNWTYQFSANAYIRNIEFIDENIGFIGTLDGVFYKSTDGGANWQAENISPNPEAICGLDAVGASTVFGCGAFFTPAYIIKSVDAGNNWEYIDMSDYADALVEVLFIDELHGYVSGQSSSSTAIILETFDGGEDWEEIYNSGIPGEYVWKLQLMENNTHIFASIQSFSQGKLLKSFDSGSTWETKNFPDADVQAVGFVSDTHGWMGGHNSGFFETTNGGDSWTNIGLGANLNRIFFIDQQLAYASGETIYKFEDVLSVTDFEETRNKELAISIAPLPIKDKLNIEVDFLHSDHLVLDLYSMSGQLLQRLSRDRVTEAGLKIYSFDFDYPAGSYILDFHTNNGRRGFKVVRQ